MFCKQSFGKYTVVRVQSPEQKNVSPPPLIQHTFVLDNSGSMGSCTHYALNSIGTALFGMPLCAPGTIIAFHDHSFIYNNIASSEDVRKIQLPRQGGTNITEAIETAIGMIASSSVENHHVLTFVSDGHHTFREHPLPVDLTPFKQLLQNHKLTVVVVGISNCDVTFGMRLKTQLQNVDVPGLESIYYAENIYECTQLCTQIVKRVIECFSVANRGTTLTLTIPDQSGRFLLTPHPHSHVMYLAPNQMELLVMVGDDARLCCNNDDKLECKQFVCTERDIECVVDKMVVYLSQFKITASATVFETKMGELEEFLECANYLFSHMEEQQKELPQAEEKKSSATKRLAQYVKKTHIRFAEQRNRLKQLHVTLSNDSASQAAFLTGMTKKYAAKAVVRAGTLGNVTHETIWSDLQCLVEKQKLLLPCKFTYSNLESSCLSCNTAIEQLDEWATIVRTMHVEDFPNIMAFLVCFGLPGYPVEYVQSNAVQMDPFQTKCTHIEPVMIDTAVLFLGLQTQKKILSPHSNKAIVNCLPLVDPTCPEKCLLAMDSSVYKCLVSCILTLDLHMYNHNMTFSIHAHAFVEAIKQHWETLSMAYLELACKIVYSLRKWFKHTKADYSALFAHWWNDWGELTHSNGCNHPVQLILLLACQENTEDKFQDETTATIPLLNLCNELLARKCKIWLASHNQESTKMFAITCLQKLFAINAEDSPKPIDDALIEEPPLETTRAACQRWADFQEDVFKQMFHTDSLVAFMHNSLHAYTSAFELGFFMAKNNVWPDLEVELESKNAIPFSTLQQMQGYLLSAKGLTDKKPLVTMLAQALLCHDSQSRMEITSADVRDSETLQNIIVDLRLSFYFDACKVKREKWSHLIGNVSFEEALDTDEHKFDSLLGGHTHGLCKQKFWAYHEVAKQELEKGQAEKSRRFLAKSNGSVTFCAKKKEH